MCLVLFELQIVLYHNLRIDHDTSVIIHLRLFVSGTLAKIPIVSICLRVRKYRVSYWIFRPLNHWNSTLFNLSSRQNNMKKSLKTLRGAVSSIRKRLMGQASPFSDLGTQPSFPLPVEIILEIVRYLLPYDCCTLLAVVR
jgi:hypothetical protein